MDSRDEAFFKVGITFGLVGLKDQKVWVSYSDFQQSQWERLKAEFHRERSER